MRRGGWEWGKGNAGSGWVWGRWIRCGGPCIRALGTGSELDRGGLVMEMACVDMTGGGGGGVKGKRGEAWGGDVGGGGGGF